MHPDTDPRGHRSTNPQIHTPKDPPTPDPRGHRSTNPQIHTPKDPPHPRSTQPTDPPNPQIHPPTDPPTHTSTHPHIHPPQIHPPTDPPTYPQIHSPQIHQPPDPPAELPYPFVPALTRIVSVKSCLVILAGPLRWKTSEGEVAACSRHVLRWPMGSVRKPDHLGHRPLVFGGRRQHALVVHSHAPRLLELLR